MNVFPATRLTMPDSRFFHGADHWRAVAKHALIETDITDHSNFSHDAHVWGSHGRAMVALGAT